MSLIQNEAVTVVYADALAERLGNETLIVTGSPRGGTSAIAYTLRRLDYFLGDQVGGKNHEDTEFKRVFDITSRRRRRSEFSKLVAERNAAHRRWGFKLPKAAILLDEIFAATRNPVAVIVYRNPLAVGRSIVGRSPGFRQDSDGFLKGVKLAAERMGVASKQALDAKVPALLINFDQFGSDVRANLDIVVETLRIPAQEQLLADIAATITEPGYKHLKKR